MIQSKVDLDALLNKTNKTVQKASAPIVPPEEEVKFQHYTSSIKAMKMISTQGIVIRFINFTYYTNNQEVIAYLDNEIRNGLGAITKGKLLTAKESDPMEVLKAAHIAEYIKEQEELARDFGDNEEGGEAASVLNPSSTTTVGDMAAQSTGAAPTA